MTTGYCSVGKRTSINIKKNLSAFCHKFHYPLLVFTQYYAELVIEDNVAITLAPTFTVFNVSSIIKDLVYGF